MLERQPTGGLPAVRTIGIDAPFRWIKDGWSDLRRALAPSLLYGMALSLLGVCLVYSLYVSGGAVWAILLSCGAVFVGPMLAMGLYEAGRLLDGGRRPTIGRMIFVRAAFRRDVAFLGLALLFIHFLWGEIGRIIYGLSTRRAHKTAAEFVDFAVSTPEGHGMLIAGFIVGGIIAFGAYCLVVVSAPMLLDRKSDFFIASITSVRAVIQNPIPMALWAFLIGAFLVFSMLTALIGLIVILPWLGFASWRAYRDLVPEGR